MLARIRVKSLKFASGIKLWVNVKSASMTLNGKRVQYMGCAVLMLALVLSGCADTASTYSSSSTTNRPSTAPPASTSPGTASRSSTQAGCSGSAKALTARMKAAGLPIRELIVYDATTDPNHLLGRQDEYTSKDAWVDPTAVAAGAGSPTSDPGGIEFGGGIEAFPSVADARARLGYLKAFRPPIGDGYDYLAGAAILRLSNYLTPAEATRFDAAFVTAACRKFSSVTSTISAASGTLTGFGATVSAWNANHAADPKFDPNSAYDPDPALPSYLGRDVYVAVQWQDGRAIDYQMNISGQPIRDAIARVLRELPADAHELWGAQLNTDDLSCYQAELVSATLGRVLAASPIDDPQGAVLVEFQTMFPGGTTCPFRDGT